MANYYIDIEDIKMKDVINKNQCTDLLKRIFQDELIQERIDDLKFTDKIPQNIYTLEEVQNVIKPTTVYIGLIKRLNDYEKNN